MQPSLAFSPKQTPVAHTYSTRIFSSAGCFVTQINFTCSSLRDTDVFFFLFRFFLAAGKHAERDEFRIVCETEAASSAGEKKYGVGDKAVCDDSEC